MVSRVVYKCWFCGREYEVRDKADSCHDSGSYAIYRDGTRRKRTPFGN